LVLDGGDGSLGPPVNRIGQNNIGLKEKKRIKQKLKAVFNVQFELIVFL
jgi:hypothetical protein